MAVSFPRYVTFKGDNGKLLCLQHEEGKPYLIYTGSVTQGLRVVHEVVPEKDGSTVMIKCMGNGNFWRQSPNLWIWADYEGVPNSSDKGTHFEPVQVNHNRVALRCVANDRFCRRFTINSRYEEWIIESDLYPKPWIVGALHASAPTTMSPSTRMIAGEPVLSRRLEEVTVLSRRLEDICEPLEDVVYLADNSQIYDIVYLMDDAEIYDIRSLVLGSSTAANNSSFKTDIILSKEYRISTSKSWNNSFPVGASITFRAKVPVITEGGIRVSDSLESNEWGDTIAENLTVVGTYTLKDLEPGSTATLTLIGKEAKCRVPFSYTLHQPRCTCENGDGQTVHRSDGLFNGGNAYNLMWEVRGGDGTIIDVASIV